MALTTDQLAQIAKLQQESQFCWLFELEIPTATIARYRLNNSAHAVEFGTDDAGAALTYSPHPFKIAGIRSDSQGGIYSLTITASNVRRELIAAIENYDGLIDRPATVMLVHKALLGSGEPLIRVDGEIAAHQASGADVSFTVGREDLYRTPLPLLRTDHDFCAHIYGGLECGFDTTQSGANQTCTFKIEGDNGCRAHGVEEAAAGLENRHPLRWGGHLGVPRRQGRRF